MNFSQPLFFITFLLSLQGSVLLVSPEHPDTNLKTETAQTQTTAEAGEEPNLEIIRCEPFPECMYWPAESSD